MPPVLIAGGIAAAGALGSAAIASSASSRNASTIANSQQSQIAAANANRDYQYNLNAPTIAHGGAADDRISALLNLGGDPAAAQAGFDAYRGSTGYDFRQSQGLNAINQHGFAGGTGQSGATLKAGMQFNQNIASDEFLKYLQEVGGVSAQGANARGLVAGVGNNATNQLINASQTGTNLQVGNTNTGAANQENLIQNLVNAGGFAFGSSYGSKTSAPPPPSYKLPPPSGATNSAWYQGY